MQQWNELASIKGHSLQATHRSDREIATDMERFVEAQASLYAQVCAELAAGRKVTHWMWFVFPQLQGFGRSSMAVKFGIDSRRQACAYWQHAALGPRLAECVELVLAVKSRTAFQIFGTPDDLKFRSSMTLFASAVPDAPIFKQALDKYFDGRVDPRTQELLQKP